MLGFDEIVNINISEIMIMLVKLYEKVRQKYYRNPVERLREKGAVIGDNVNIYDGGGASIDYNFCFLPGNVLCGLMMILLQGLKYLGSSVL